VIYADDEPLVSFADGLSNDDKHYYERIVMAAATAREENEVAAVYRFYDDSERKKFDRVYERELKALRAKA
jgi:hypothetical protein